MTELKQVLRTALAERNTESLRDNIKKVIMYMTLGIDMSRLFSEMVMASQLGDTVQKKMVYLYLTTYAEENADLAILAVNTLQKDTKDVDPSVRGLALRSLCSLHLANMVEYLEPAISAGLSDPSGYVRKTAVLGVLKLSALGGNGSGFESTIASMLVSDRDSMVVSNCISVLTELGSVSKLVTQELVYTLINRFSEFSEWARCQAMESIISHYYPKDDDELFSLMNALDMFFKQSSAPVSFAIIKIFLSWTSVNPDLYHQVLNRVKDPILTLLSAASQSLELQHAILAQIEVMVRNSVHFRSLLNEHWKQFLISDCDSLASSKLKFKILAQLESSPQLLAELCSYVSRRKISKSAVTTITHLAKTEDICSLIELLISTAETQPAVCGFCVSGIGNILRKFPEHFGVLTENREFIDTGLDTLLRDPSAPNSVIGLEAITWLLGRFDLDDAPYQLEKIFDSNVQNSVLRILIPSCVELFLKRPLETRALVHNVLAFGIDECTDPDTRDVALMHFRLLRSLGPEKLRLLFASEEAQPELNRTITPSDTQDLLVDFNVTF